MYEFYNRFTYRYVSVQNRADPQYLLAKRYYKSVQQSKIRVTRLSVVFIWTFSFLACEIVQPSLRAEFPPACACTSQCALTCFCSTCLNQVRTVPPVPYLQCLHQALPPVPAQCSGHSGLPEPSIAYTSTSTTCTSYVHQIATPLRPHTPGTTTRTCNRDY